MTRRILLAHARFAVRVLAYAGLVVSVYLLDRPGHGVGVFVLALVCAAVVGDAIGRAP